MKNGKKKKMKWIINIYVYELIHYLSQAVCEYVNAILVQTLLVPCF